MKKIILAITVAIATNYPWVNMPVRAQTRSMSLDEMTITLGRLGAIVTSCPQKFQPRDEVPLGEIVSTRGYNLNDFTNGRYEKSMDARMAQAIKYLKSNGTVKGCTAMRDAIEKYLPELYSNNISGRTQEKLPFIGTRYYNFGGEGDPQPGQGHSITIDRDGNTIIKILGMKNDLLFYTGKFSNPIKFKRKGGLLIKNNKIYLLSPQWEVMQICKENSEQPCESELYEH
jgi:hypothetical protein